MEKDEKIIVSMTSWKKRINNVANVINDILKQTLLPNKIILNLSSDEFKNGRNDLPIELLKTIDTNELCELYWVKEDTKPYKKLIPTLLRFPNDVIITIDDDIEYPKNFIELMYKEYLAYEKQCPIVSSKYVWEGGVYNHFGANTLIKKEFLGDYVFDLYENLYKKSPSLFPFSDPIFTYSVLLNGRRYRATRDLDMNIYRRKHGQDKNSLSRLGNDSYIKMRDNEHKLIREYIKTKYNKTYSDLLDAKLFVNITTYPLRDMYLPLMLENLKKQTKKPDKIILWLSEEEYDKSNIPLHIQKCLNNKLLTEIRWTEKNIYCHKRHEVFKTDNDVYNVFMDDDLLYENTYLETIYNSAKKHSNCVTTMAAVERGFVGSKQLSNKIKEKQSVKNTIMGGLSCVPPYVFPLESFKYTTIRDECAKKCDETWLQCWCIITDTKVNAIKNRPEYNLHTIGNSQSTALWNENKQMETKNLTFKNVMFIKTAYKLGIIPKIKEIFPKFYIDNEITKIIPEILEQYKNQQQLVAKKENVMSSNIVVSMYGNMVSKQIKTVNSKKLIRKINR